MRNLIATALLGVSCLLSGAPPCPLVPAPSTGVLCCCTSVHGGLCCAEMPLCSRVVPGCVCKF